MMDKIVMNEEISFQLLFHERNDRIFGGSLLLSFFYSESMEFLFKDPFLQTPALYSIFGKLRTLSIHQKQCVTFTSMTKLASFTTLARMTTPLFHAVSDPKDLLAAGSAVSPRESLASIAIWMSRLHDF